MGTPITVRTSALAVKPETTEGTPVRPTASTDYVALQDDFSMEPALEQLENAELKASLGRSATQLGAEDPTASFSHYLRHSGTEGDAPNYRELLITTLGQEDDAGVEHDATAGTTLSVDVDVGEGATYIRGQALLVKHAASPYEIRVTDSVTGDQISPSFNFDNAPAATTLLGEAISYTVLNSGHQTVSLWHYMGNEGAIQMMAGARVSGATYSFTAGEFINANYSFEGLEYYFDPIEIAATDTYLDFTDDGGTFAAQITAQEYKDPHDLAAALTTAMNTVQTAETHSVTYSDTTGKFTVATSTSTVLSLLWNTGVNAANTVGDALGFSTAADDTLATTYEADNAQDYSSPQTPSFDSSDPLAAKNNEVFLGDQADNVCIPANSVEIAITNTIRKSEDVCAASGRSGSIVNLREVEITMAGQLDKYDADKFRRFREGATTRFQYNFGTKSGGNWVAGKCGAWYAPTCKITSFSAVDNDGIFDFNITLQPFVDSGNSLSDEEIYLSFV